MPLSGRVKVQFISYLDPDLEIEIITQEDYSWLADSYIDEKFIISELEKILINGLAILETH